METRAKTTLETFIATSALACAAVSLGANMQGGYISEKPETYHAGISIPTPTDADKLIICSLGLLTAYRNLRRNE